MTTPALHESKRTRFQIGPAEKRPLARARERTLQDKSKSGRKAWKVRANLMCVGPCCSSRTKVEIAACHRGAGPRGGGGGGLVTRKLAAVRVTRVRTQADTRGSDAFQRRRGARVDDRCEHLGEKAKEVAVATERHPRDDHRQRFEQRPHLAG